MKKLNKITAFILALLVCTSVTGVADAAQYDVYIVRGVKHIAYVKSTIEWNTNSTKIKSVDKDQIVSGICIRGDGISKVKSKSTKTKHIYDCKTTSIAGVDLGTFTLGYSHTYKDRVTIYKNGDYAVDWDD